MFTRVKYLMAGCAGFGAALLLLAVASAPTALGPRESVAAASSLTAAGPPASVTYQIASPDAATATRMAMVGQVIAAVAMLDSSGFHQMDEAIDAGTVPPGSLGRVRRARLVTAAVSWPAPLQDSARRLQGHLGDLLVALQAEDLQAAKAPMHEAHELEHDLSNAAYAWLGELGSLAGGSGDQGMLGNGH